MSTGLQLAIDEILKEIDAKEAELLPLKIAANTLSRRIPIPEPFPGAELGERGVGNPLATSKLNWRIDQFFNKPLATSVVDILTARKVAGLDGPCTVDDLFESLKAGGFKFLGASGSDENTKRGIKIALTKNTAQFVKIGEDMFGLKSWYGASRGRPKKTKSEQSEAMDDLLGATEDDDQVSNDQPGAESDDTMDIFN